MRKVRFIGAVIAALSLTFITPVVASATEAFVPPNIGQYCHDVYETQDNPDYVAAVDQWWSWTGGQSETHPFPSGDWNPDNGNHNGTPFQGHINEAFQVSQGNSANWFYRQVTPAVGEPTIQVKVGEECSLWVTWAAPGWYPNATDSSNIGWDQSFVALGQVAPTECETTYQQDLYVGARADIEALLADGILTGPNPPEDHLVVEDWNILSTEECPVEPGVATASWDKTPPTCEDLNGSGYFSYENATLVSATRDGDPYTELGNFPEGTHENPGTGAWVLTFEADDGFEFAGGETTATVEFTIVHKAKEDCYTHVTALFDVNPGDPTCDAPGTLNTGVFPIEREFYTLTVDRPFEGPGVYTITATPKAEVVIDGPLTKEVTVLGATGYQNENDEAPCFYTIVPQPAAPTSVDLCGTANDSLTVPEDTEFVEYSVEWPSKGHAVVTANLINPVDEFPEGTVTEWEFTFTDVACPGLAQTGDETAMQAGVAGALTALGVALLTFGLMRSRRAQGSLIK